MEAVKFLEECNRMCKSFSPDCEGCPLEGAKCTLGTTMSVEEYEKIIADVEQWSKEHPRKTRQSVFLNQWPEVAIDAYGVLNLCPVPISKSHRNIYGGCAHPGSKCDVCRREFWMEEVE